MAIDGRLRSAEEILEVGQSEASRADQEQSALEEGLRNLLAERDRMMGLLRTALETHESAVAAVREASRYKLSSHSPQRCRCSSPRRWKRR